MCYRAVVGALLSLVAAAAALVPSTGALAQGDPNGLWQSMADFPAGVQAQGAWVRPAKYRAVRTSLAALRQAYQGVLLEPGPQDAMLEAVAAPPTVVQLPDPDGGFQAFRVYESPVMAPELAAQFPTIKTYVGQGLDDAAATLRMDVTDQGMHAQVLSPRGAWYIDPFSRDNTEDYAVYYKREMAAPHRFVCETVAPPNENAVFLDPAEQPDFLASGPTLRTYRAAVAATGEYTAFHGGTVALGQAAIVTAMNRVTGVYEVELGVRMTLVANNSLLVYTNSGTDPYTNTNGSTMLGQNQTNIDSVIGSANYDIGHVFSTGGGGIAGLGVVCSAGNKARGVTGSASPTGDAFWIDFVAHEIGHQYGGNHTFNGTGGNCAGGNRNAGTAYEIGSGSTIQAYAGICSADDLQPNSDPYFHFISIQEMNAYTQSGGGSGCSVNTATGNSAPSVSAGAAFTIPRGTPFMLTATGSDPNGDPLTFCWEERDLGAATTLAAADNGASPIIRSLNPTTSPTRTVPKLSTVVAGTVDNAEKVPAVGRSAFNWRVTARDNRANGGGVAHADVTHVVSGVAGPFTVTSPSSATSWPANSVQNITWNVAGTTANGVNTANVQVLLSTDGGVTFPIVVAASVPNSGSAAVTIPNNQTTAGRLMVKAVGNIFFAVNTGVITITAPVAGVVLSGAGGNSISDTTGNGNSNGRIDPGETAIALTVPVRNNGTNTATGVTGTLTSLTGTVSVTTGGAAYPNIAGSGASASNTTPYVISVSSGHPCGDPINLRLNIASNEAMAVYDFTLPTGLPGGAGAAQTFTYAGGAVAIPDNSTVGATADLVVSGVTGTINDVNFRFNGSLCSNSAGSTTVGLDHTYVGDLVITLRSPTGTIVTLANRPGSAAGGSSGNNFCNTIFDDSGGLGSIQSIVSTGAPYSGSYTPTQALSTFNGQNPNGTWQLKVVDAAGVDTGSIRAFSIVVTGSTPPSCDPPLVGPTCPSFTTNPASANVCEGTGVSFTVAAAGTAPITYQWRKNGIDIAGATGTTYSIPAPVAGDAGSYDCVATNACGSATSSAATLTVRVAPAFTTNPSPATVCAGEPASFTAAASGTGPVTFQWRRNGAPIGGATSATYSIPAAGPGDAGSYDCIATNSCGSALSNSAALTVRTPPAITSQPGNQSVCVGDGASFSVAASGSATLTYQWRKDGFDIPGATADTYTIGAAALADAGVYDCVVSNTCGSATSDAATLSTGASVAIDTQPGNQSAAAGGSASFTVGASGAGPLSYQWRKDGSDIPGANDATLTIDPVNTGDAGSYDCVVSGACGPAQTTEAATLTVSAGCITDYNGDGQLNPDDLGDYITDYYTSPPVPGPGGYAVGCAEEGPPYDVGYRVDYDQNCQINPDDLGDYITQYYLPPEFGGC